MYMGTYITYYIKYIIYIYIYEISVGRPVGWMGSLSVRSADRLCPRPSLPITGMGLPV